MRTIRIFEYIDFLDCFVVNPAYKAMADDLGLTEWNEVVWIGRYFTLDNDLGEHWFDNWELRDQLESKAKEVGIAYNDLLIIDPERCKNEMFGPGQKPPERTNFWRDVFRSHWLSMELNFSEARKHNTERGGADDFINDLENRIRTYA
jgi:hypothetical protein